MKGIVGSGQTVLHIIFVVMGLNLLQTVVEIGELEFNKIGQLDILVGELARDLLVIGSIDSGRLSIIFRFAHRKL